MLTLTCYAVCCVDQSGAASSWSTASTLVVKLVILRMVPGSSLDLHWVILSRGAGALPVPMPQSAMGLTRVLYFNGGCAASYCLEDGSYGDRAENGFVAFQSCDLGQLRGWYYAPFGQIAIGQIGSVESAWEPLANTSDIASKFGSSLSVEQLFASINYTALNTSRTVNPFNIVTTNGGQPQFINTPDLLSTDHNYYDTHEGSIYLYRMVPLHAFDWYAPSSQVGKLLVLRQTPNVIEVNWIPQYQQKTQGFHISEWSDGFQRSLYPNGSYHLSYCLEDGSYASRPATTDANDVGPSCSVGGIRVSMGSNGWPVLSFGYGSAAYPNLAAAVFDLGTTDTINSQYSINYDASEIVASINYNVSFDQCQIASQTTGRYVLISGAGANLLPTTVNPTVIPLTNHVYIFRLTSSPQTTGPATSTSVLIGKMIVLNAEVDRIDVQWTVLYPPSQQSSYCVSSNPCSGATPYCLPYAPDTISAPTGYQCTASPSGGGGSGGSGLNAALSVSPLWSVVSTMIAVAVASVMRL